MCRNFPMVSSEICITLCFVVCFYTVLFQNWSGYLCEWKREEWDECFVWCLPDWGQQVQVSHLYHTIVSYCRRQTFFYLLFYFFDATPLSKFTIYFLHYYSSFFIFWISFLSWSSFCISVNPHQNDQGGKGPCYFQRLIALKCLKCQKI